MKPHVTIKDVDRGWRQLRRDLKSAHVKVGYFAGPKDARPGDPITNVELAVVHEFGSPGQGIPERSFMRSTIDAQTNEYIGVLNKLLKMALSARAVGTSVTRALGILGEKVSADIKKRVMTGEHIPPPLKPRTIARKGSDRPLIDTGRLITAITYLVSTGDEKK